MKFIPASLVLKDTRVFHGFAPSWQKKNASGEVVFLTGMTGYTQTLTDSSYAGQIITFTYPLIGNYGVAKRRTWESPGIRARGVVISDICLAPSHAQSVGTLLEWLKSEDVPVIIGIDTRALTKKLRKTGVMLGTMIMGEQQKSLRQRYAFDDPNTLDLVGTVSIKKPVSMGKGKKTVIVVDCGTKEGILRALRTFPLRIRRVPYDYDYTDELFDGVVISNGPGDPTRCRDTIAILAKVLEMKKPIFGICLGTQLLALASGAKTYKLPYGHRGQNQPCQEEKTRRCFITSQNHGYAILEKSLKKDWRVSFRNMNDGSVEGIVHEKLPYFAVQFHPEANPGPMDTAWMFETFYKLL